MQYVKIRKPRSVLDVGVGCGKYGMLFREYLDGHWADSAFHDPETWTMRMVGVEVFAEYLTPVHAYLYDDIFVGDYQDLIDKITESFDLIFFGDVLEHFPKEKAIELLLESGKKLNRGGAMIISTPNFKTDMNPNRQGPFGNQFELHKCRLMPEEFDFPGYKISMDKGRLLTVFMEKE